MKYQKKPVVIEAIQWFGKQSFDELYKFADADNNLGIIGILDENNDIATIRTLEGVMQASPNDYIIKGIKGELYPCKPDIFEMTYDKADLDLKERMQKEHDELEEKRGKLLEFRSDFEKWSALEKNERRLLECQYHAMWAYSISLFHRIELLD